MSGMINLGQAVVDGRMDFDNARSMLVSAHVRMFGAPDVLADLVDRITIQLVDAINGREGPVGDEPLMKRLAVSMAADRLSWADATRIATDRVMARVKNAPELEQQDAMYWNAQEKQWQFERNFEEERDMYRSSVETAISYRLDVLSSALKEKGLGR